MVAIPSRVLKQPTKDPDSEDAVEYALPRWDADPARRETLQNRDGQAGRENESPNGQYQSAGRMVRTASEPPDRQHDRPDQNPNPISHCRVKVAMLQGAAVRVGAEVTCH